jgi:hypothetical protein
MPAPVLDPELELAGVGRGEEGWPGVGDEAPLPAFVPVGAS